MKINDWPFSIGKQEIFTDIKTTDDSGLNEYRQFFLDNLTKTRNQRMEIEQKTLQQLSKIYGLIAIASLFISVYQIFGEKINPIYSFISLSPFFILGLIFCFWGSFYQTIVSSAIIEPTNLRSKVLITITEFEREIYQWNFSIDEYNRVIKRVNIAQSFIISFISLLVIHAVLSPFVYLNLIDYVIIDLFGFSFTLVLWERLNGRKKEIVIMVPRSDSIK